MGWSSAGDIFNKVADAFIAEQATDRLKANVLGPLIDVLRDGDWDTWDESREQYTADPAISELFAKLGREFYGNGEYGEIDFSGGRWSLRCSHHGILDVADDNAAEHDRLVRLWASHDQADHGGDGEVDRDWLINAGAVNG